MVNGHKNRVLEVENDVQTALAIYYAYIALQWALALGIV